MRLFSPFGQFENLVDQAANAGNPRRAPDQNHFADLFDFDACILNRLPTGRDGPLNDRTNQLLKLIAGDLSLIALARRQGDVECGRTFRGQRDFCVDHRLANRLDGFPVASHVQAEIAGNVLERNRDQQIVNVVAAQVRVAVGGNHFKDAIVQFQNGDIECAAAEVVHSDDAVFLLVQTVGERGRRRLIHQSQHFQAGNSSCIFGCLTLRIVEIRRHRDDRLFYGDTRTKKALCVLLQLTKNVGGHFRRSQFARTQLDAKHFAGSKILRQPKREKLQLLLNILHAATHQPFHGVDSTIRSLQQIRARSIADDESAVRGERNHRGHQVRTVFAGNDHWLVTLHKSDQRVGRAQIDAYYTFVSHA